MTSNGASLGAILLSSLRSQLPVFENGLFGHILVLGYAGKNRI
jgi:hypothetical protein